MPTDFLWRAREMETEALVVGGGPAGAAVSIHLARKGWRVRLIEKSAFAKDKVCGEFLTPESEPFLKDLGVLDRIEQAGAHAVREILVAAPNGKCAKAPLNPEAEKSIGICLSRKRLDALLLEKAKEEGVRVERGTSFEIKALDSKNGPRVSSEAPVVIDARGKSAGSSGEASAARPKKGSRWIGFKTHFTELESSEAIELYLFREGYLGVVQIEEPLFNVCGIVKEEILEKARGNFDELLKLISRENPVFLSRIQGGRRVIPWLSVAPLRMRHGKVYEKGIFYVGDAASFIDPFSGEGMLLAMESADLVAKLLPSPNPRGINREEIGRAYEKAWEHRFSSRMKTCASLRRVTQFSFLENCLVEIFRRSPFLFQRTIRKTREPVLV